MDAGSYTWLRRCVHVGEAGVPTSRAFSKVQSPNVVMYSLPDSVHMEGSGGEREASDVANQSNWTLCIKMIHIHDRRLLRDLLPPMCKNVSLPLQRVASEKLSPHGNFIQCSNLQKECFRPQHDRAPVIRREHNA